MMPTKLKPDTKILVDRKSKKVKTVRHFMHIQSTKDLLDMVQRDNVKPKDKQKIRNELTKRGVTMIL